MSYLLFMDESGHDHRKMPYEVRGGIALHAKKLWPFIQAIRSAESLTFGDLLHRHGTEIKGHRLLNRERFRWASQDEVLDDTARRRYALSFLNKTVQQRSAKRIEFTAYGQACLTMARETFRLLREHEAVLFASAIPRGVPKPKTYQAVEFLRKDHVFLLERYFYFLEQERDHGLIIMDETEKKLDRDFVRRLQRYFIDTENGRYRTTWVVPVPFFVSSDMTYPVQAADLCIYCVNTGFRLPSRGMNAPVREEISREFGPWLNELQFRGEGYRDGEVFHTYGIFHVPDPYTPRQEKERR